MLNNILSLVVTARLLYDACFSPQLLHLNSLVHVSSLWPVASITSLVVLTFFRHMTKLLTLIAPNRIRYVLCNWDIQVTYFFRESGILRALKVNIRVFVLISMLFLFTTISCTSEIIGTFSLISSGSVLASSQFLTTPFELFSDLCGVTTTWATLPNNTHFRKLSDWDFFNTGQINVTIKRQFNGDIAPCNTINTLMNYKG